MRVEVTLPTTKLTGPAEAVLAELRDDHADLWKLLWVVGVEAGLDEAKTEAVRLRTISVVAELLKGGYACVGDPDGRDGFAPWALTEEQALTRIEREWDALGREPDIAEIAWFGLTEKGEEYLAEPRLTNEHALDDRSS